MTRGALALLVVAGIALTACGGGDASVAERRQELAEVRAEEAVDAGWDQQAEVLADGEVTADEYDGIIASFIECMTAGGATMSDPIPHPANPRLVITATTQFGTDSDRYNDALLSCTDTYLVSVQELLWEDPAPMEPALAADVRTCMEEADTPLDEGDDDLREMARTVGEEGTGDLTECISDGMLELDPDLPVVLLALPSIL